MNIHLHIERLVLDGVDAAQPQLLQAAVQAELTRLLAQGGVAPSLAGGTFLPHVALPSITLAQGEAPASAGARIAASVYGGIGK